MANPEHLKILKQGGGVWNKWRLDHIGLRPNLIEADLSGTDLRGANLYITDLTRAVLNRANLANAQLFSSTLDQASFMSADLTGANLTFASLRDANLSNASLKHANLVAAILLGPQVNGANFAEVVLGTTVFADIDLSLAERLEDVTHTGPSTLGIDTLYRSKGKIPEAFLRGCGVPEEMIEFSRSLIGRPIEFNSCFISYSTKNEEFARRLHNDLQSNGVRCWFAPHDMKGGKKLHDQIDWAIHYHDRTLLILSPDSINSHWVKTEIAKARKREIEEKRQVQFPIRLVDFDALRKWEYFDADTGTDYAKEIREYFIPDFSNWKDHDSYQAAFKKLLGDLRGERTKTAPASK